MTGKVVTLPGQEALRERLERAFAGHVAIDHYRQRVFPIFLRKAGEERTASGIMMMTALAIHDSTVGMPPAISGLMVYDVEKMIEALTDDEEVRAEARELLAEFWRLQAAKRK